MDVLTNLLAAARLRRREVDVDGAKVIVQEMTNEAFRQYGELMKSDRNAAELQVIQQGVVDENGAPIMTMEQAAEVGKSARLRIALVNAVLELSGFGEDTTKKD